jgi:hypothetical protein
MDGKMARARRENDENFSIIELAQEKVKKK